jgi:hypothetical protein
VLEDVLRIGSVAVAVVESSVCVDTSAGIVGVVDVVTGVAEGAGLDAMTSCTGAGVDRGSVTLPTSTFVGIVVAVVVVGSFVVLC